MRAPIRIGMPVAVGAAAVVFAGAAAALAQYPPYPTPAPSPTPSPVTRAANTVNVVDFAFHPKTITIHKGKTVTWTFKHTVGHNVTFRSLHKHSATIRTGHYSLKFAKAGTYHYLCTIHGFTGTVVVK